MPARESKKHHDAPATNQKLQLRLRPAVKPAQATFSRAGHNTRINAFVNSLGRRNQAKRDSR